MPTEAEYRAHILRRLDEGAQTLRDTADDASRDARRALSETADPASFARVIDEFAAKLAQGHCHSIYLLSSALDWESDRALDWESDRQEWAAAETSCDQ